MAAKDFDILDERFRRCIRTSANIERSYTGCRMKKFSVRDGVALENEELFATCDDGMYDGLRIDVENRIWTSAGESVHCYEPDGTLIGRILLPERVSNLTFGGPKRNRLYITATSSLYSVLVAVSGAEAREATASSSRAAPP